MNATAEDTDNHAVGCGCSACKLQRKKQQAFTAAGNRRDLWSEMSFHAAHNRDSALIARDMMRATEHELQCSEFSVSWWATKASEQPMAYWFRRIKSRLIGSGITPLGLDINSAI